MCERNIIKWHKKWKFKDLKPVYQRFYSMYKTMLSYCLKCKNNTGSKNPKLVETKKGTIMLL